MRATPVPSAPFRYATMIELSLVTWTIFSWIQQTRQATSTVAIALSLWLYRVARHDRTAVTDTVLAAGVYALRNGLPSSQDVVQQLLPSWVVEERFMEAQIFAMTFAMALSAGLIAYRGEERSGNHGSKNHFMIPLFLVSVTLSLWANDVRTIQDIVRLVLPNRIIEERPMELQFFAMVTLLVMMAGVIVWRGEEQPHVRFAETLNDSLKEALLPPLLIPGRTSHTRLFPEKHSFDYSYLSVGVPIGWTGCAGSVLSSDIDHLDHLSCGLSKRRRGWFDVSAKDYLSRNEHDCLEHKLRHYLQEQGVQDEEWSFAYLITAPRFLGYSFNPVSFWYIYDSEANLCMMILEVNNTFDERRLYLLKAQQDTTAPITAVEDEQLPLPANSVKFTNSWQKDFHVSPFNDREGIYTLTAQDPLQSFRQTQTQSSTMPSSSPLFFNNLVVLSTLAGKPKLTARVFSTSAPISPLTISTSTLAIFLLKWFHVPFLTFPRIIRQALTLYLLPTLSLYYKPSPLPSTQSRASTASERNLEAFFRSYVQSLVADSDRALKVKYEPPEGMSQSHIFVSQGITVVDEADAITSATSASGAMDIRIKVLTPEFYTRIQHYSTLAEALEREGGSNVQASNRTVSVSSGGDQDVEALLAIIKSAPVLSSTNDETSQDNRRGWGNEGLLGGLRWSIMHHLRCPPAEPAYPSPAVTEGVALQGYKYLASSKPSDLDSWVRETRSGKDRGVYVNTLTRMFLAERFTWGAEGLVDLVDLVMRGLIVALAVAYGSWGGLAGVSLWRLAKGV